MTRRTAPAGAIPQNPASSGQPHHSPGRFLRLSPVFPVMLLVIWHSLAAADPLKHQWCRFQTPHVAVTTNLEEPKARELVRTLALFHAAAEQKLLPYIAVSSTPAELLIFSSRKDFSKATKAGFYAGYTQPSLLHTRIVLAPNRSGNYLITTALHEYTHFLMRNRPVFFPIWFEEGYASYLSSAEFHPNLIRLGRLPEDRGPEVSRDSLPGMSRLINTRDINQLSERRASRFYARAWLLTQYLNNGSLAGFPDHRPQLARFLETLNQGVPASVAFEQAFSMSYRQLDTKLKRYSRLPELPTRQISVALPAPAEAEKQCLPDIQTHLLLAQAVTSRNPRYAEKLLRFVIARQPGNIEALVGLSMALAERGELEQAETQAMRAYATEQDRALTAVALANVLIRRCRAEPDEACAGRWLSALALYREAIRVDPDRMDAVYGLGVGRLYQGLPGEALNYFRVAYRKAPWSPILNYYLGESYARIGMYARARVHLERAANWAVTSYVRQAAETALTRLPDSK